MSSCVSSNFFQIGTPTVFLLLSQNLVHMVYVPVCKKNCGTVFRNFDFKFFSEFLKFYMCT